MINISIDPPDLKHQNGSPGTNTEDLSVNEIESVYELIAEGVFDVELPESDEDEIDTSSPSFDLYFFERTGSKLQAFIFPIEHFCHYYKNFSSIHQEPHYHPPEVA
jgi:hypothetical protein